MLVQVMGLGGARQVGGRVVDQYSMSGKQKTTDRILQFAVRLEECRDGAVCWGLPRPDTG